jgi:hypothetical protein
MANNDTSRWIGPADVTNPIQADGPGGDYVYSTTFTLPSNAQLSSAIITGDWTSDNAGLDILINGVSTGQTNTGAFGMFFPFSISSGFVYGTNTLDFVINNADAVAGPTGLRVANLSGSFSLVPEPSTGSLATLGLLSLGFVGWRRRRRA